MAHFAKVARLADLPPGTGRMVVGPFDKPMALFNVGGEVFAFNAVCPLRVTKEVELEGLDVPEFGMLAYPEEEGIPA